MFFLDSEGSTAQSLKHIPNALSSLNFLWPPLQRSSVNSLQLFNTLWTSLGICHFSSCIKFAYFILSIFHLITVSFLTAASSAPRAQSVFRAAVGWFGLMYQVATLRPPSQPPIPLPASCSSGRAYSSDDIRGFYFKKITVVKLPKIIPCSNPPN